MSKIDIRPIGKVSTEPNDIFPSYSKHKSKLSTLTIFQEYEQCLDGIEGFSHIIVCYWAHLVSQEERSLKKVHPKGNRNLPEKGIFATRSQARPNPICLTTVNLLKRKDNHLLVKNLDALNKSPILDIKPHIIHFDSPSNPSLPDWVKRLRKKSNQS
jgi:tRNA-Thr(GGU) m(6)t(6)A37 methyltransferase TsaA